MTSSTLLRDLRSLSNLLLAWKHVKNPGILNRITPNIKGNSILYSISKNEPLIFVGAEIDRHCLPSGIEKLPDTEVFIKLTTLHKEICEECQVKDPIESLGVNIAMDANYCKGDDVVTATCSWHLDRDSSTTSDFYHPIYHMHFGGEHMEAQPNNFGNLLLLNAPRVIHPPMDIILSCDFIIRNFYSKNKSKSIVENRAYQVLLDRAKDRYWRPFAMAFASRWNLDLKIDNLPASGIYGH